MPAFSLGLGERYKLPLTISPGPGKYFEKSKDDTEISPKTKTHRTPKSENHKSNKPFIITPGPGAHEVPSCFAHGKKNKKNQSDSKPLSKNSDDKANKFVVPGPGAYDPKTLKASKLITFGYKFDGIQLNESVKPQPTSNAGPGAYEVSGNLLKKPISNSPTREQRMASESEITLNNEYKKPCPGPGAYSPTLQKVYDFSRKSTMGMLLTQQNASSIYSPGPGAYQIDSSIGKGCPKFGFGSVTTQAKEVNITAPTQLLLSDSFDKSVPNTLPGVKIVEPTSHSRVDKAYQIPGPGNYDVVKSIDECIKIKQ